jgi:hypothetical protein
MADPNLGPVTEARFAEVFGKGAQATAKDAAWLLGIDTDTLNDMTDDGSIRAVRRGSLRSWVEVDLRRFLLEGPDVAKREIQPVQNVASRGVGKVVLFTQLADTPSKRPKAAHARKR